MRALRSPVAWALIVLLAACTPALNWREVTIGPLRAMLPCKPDQGARTVQLMDQGWAMHMTGCEAGGALYAISYVELADTAMASAMTQAWRVSALERMQAVSTTDAAMRPGSGASAVVIQAKGKRPDGTAVQAQLRWFSVGSRLFHAAVYAPRLSTELTEPFFSELPQR